LTLDLKSYWYAYPVEVYPHTKVDRNRNKKICGWTDVRADGRMDGQT